MSETDEAGDVRLHQLKHWLGSETNFGGMRVVPASEDASFRRYFRILDGMGQSWIAMDAPPEKEDSRPFVKIAALLREGGVRVPEVYASDMDQGFLVIEDFGAVHFEDILAEHRRDAYYDAALGEMVRITAMPSSAADQLPPYDRKWLQMELDIFHDWFLQGTDQAGSPASLEEFHRICAPLLQGVLDQPRAFVHRDFHCRNLLMLDGGRVGVIDFQGALQGPLTYDLASLLRDCYQDNPTPWVEYKALQQKRRFEIALGQQWSDEQFLLWLDWTGLQRHLKVLGLFNRLRIRDGKPSYMKDLPRVWAYAQEVLGKYPELAPLRLFVEGFNAWNEAAA